MTIGGVGVRTDLGLQPYFQSTPLPGRPPRGEEVKRDLGEGPLEDGRLRVVETKGR